MQTEAINNIKFGILPSETIRKASVVKLSVPDTYNEDGYPIDNGLLDQRMGVIDPGLVCKTCGARAKVCPGHFGHIDLVRPVIHSEFSKIIYAVLDSICQKCGRILMTGEQLEQKADELKEIIVEEKPALESQHEAPQEREAKEDESGSTDENVQKQGRRSKTDHGSDKRKRASMFKKLKSIRTCPHCGAPQEKVKFEAPTYFYIGDRRMRPDEIRDMFVKVSDDDLRSLGIDPEISRPENLIITALLVPPVNVRPSVTLETGERSEDDLTHKLVDIMRINQRLEQNINAGAPPIIIDDLWELLQYNITTYFNNETSGIPPARHRSGRALKTIAQRLKGKEGRFRYNLSGKRVNFSARTVISVDPNIGLDEVGVPRIIAGKLTVPFYVTEWNFERAKQMMERTEYPMVLSIISKDGKRKRVTETNREELIKGMVPHDILERQLVDGDIAVFNRQPSLHRMSMMAHKVKVLPGKTFRMNFCVTHPYNADFDGDEMNLHIPQTLEAQAEAVYLMSVKDQIFSPRDGAAIISGDEDDITGLYLLTLDDTELTKEDACYLLGLIGITELPDPRRNGMYSGKDIFSMLLPEGLDVEQKGKSGTFEVKKGKLTGGRITKEIYTHNSRLLSAIAYEYGAEALKRFIEISARLADAYVTLYGTTVGIKEYQIDRKVQEEREASITEIFERTSKLIEQYKAGKLESLIGYTAKQSLEMQIMAELAKAIDIEGEIITKHANADNNAVRMVRAGSRGSIFNLVQMSMLLGQQSTLSGGRIKRGYYTNRVLPHIKPGSIDPRSRGFVTTNFYIGLSPIDIYMHAIGSRTSVVYKALLTARSGYLQRRLMNALQDYYVEQDLSVRDVYGNMIETVYAGDGIDPVKLSFTKIKEKK